MLIFPLKKEWYEKIKSGEKTVEYREQKAYWSSRLLKIIDYVSSGMEWECWFQLGYKPETRLRAMITKIEIVDGRASDLMIDDYVFAIHFRLEEW